ncbi:MAG TPA: beta-ketoacyl synthase N-terminal-like domain-containing protein [Kofleriaceae bacterium]
MTAAILGAAAISRYGASWRGLGEALADGAVLPGVPAELPLGDARVRAKVQKMMSRGAYLAASCLGALVRDTALAARGDCGYFLGVGASGGSLDDVTALLAESIAGGAFSLAQFGERGLGACNPLLAFQLMNNFTLCHGAILEGIGGPNAALFSRGAGTTAALIEAVHAIGDGDCAQAIAGGADSALHPVTLAELAREPRGEPALAPSEGAALVLLGAVPGDANRTGAAVVRDPSQRPAAGVAAHDGAAQDGLALAPSALLAVVEGCAIASGQARPLADAIEEAATRAGFTDGDVVVIAPWCPLVAAELRGWARANAPDALVIDTSGLGEVLAASPALAWLAALDLLVAGRGRRALVLNAGIDGDIGAVVLAREGPGA